MRYIYTKKIFIALTLVTTFVTSSLVSGGTVEAYTQPGYNGRIFFTSPYDGSNIYIKREIYSQRLDGSQKARITTNETYENHLNLSPDGTKLVYYNGTDGELYTMGLDGSSQTKLTNSPGLDWTPVWSPDGAKIAFRSERTGNSEIFVMNADGSDQTNISNNADPTFGLDHSPAWTKDGKDLFFVSRRSGTQQIYKYDYSDQSLSNISNRTENAYSPKISPNGETIAFIAEVSGTYTVMIMDLDGSNQIEISNSAHWADSHAWSPDGKKIAYISYENGGYVVRIFDLDTNEDALIADFLSQPLPTEWPVGIVWSPDGKELLSTVYIDDSYWPTDIYHINIASGEIKAFSSDNYSDVQAWESIPNISPVTTPDTVSVPFQTPTLVDVLANDTDEEAFSGTNLSITVQPINGIASIVDGKVRYTPSTGFIGTDSLAYQICDSFTLDQKCATAIVDIIVLAPTAPAVNVGKVGGVSFSASTGSYTTSSSRPTFSGTATPGAEIKVEIHSDPIVLTTTADSNGNWSVTPTFDLPSGEHMVYISATLNGLTTELGAFGLMVGALADTGESLDTTLAVAFATILLGGAMMLSRVKKNLL